VENGASALSDSAYGSLARFVAQRTWQDLTQDEAEADLGRDIRKRAFRWGVEVLNVQFRDLTVCKSLRLWQAQVYE
jgi:regulator of protease activity HflC (stomatin/prohibitin superfamily)